MPGTCAGSVSRPSEYLHAPVLGKRYERQSAAWQCLPRALFADECIDWSKGENAAGLGGALAGA